MSLMPTPYRNLPPAELIDALKEKEYEIDGRKHRLGANPLAASIHTEVELSPSVQKFNRVAADMKAHIIGYATFLGMVSEDDDGKRHYNRVHDNFMSANGSRRVFQQYISEPIYYDEDLAHFQQLASGPEPSWLVTDKPINSQALKVRDTLAKKSHKELLLMAQQMYPNVIRQPDTMLHHDLVDALVKADFRGKRE